MTTRQYGTVILLFLLAANVRSEDPAPQASKPASALDRRADPVMMTRWGKGVNAENVWSEYPRPSLVRREWLNLNGYWDYAIVGSAEEPPATTLINAEADPLLKAIPNPPEKWDGRILVPFAPESRLSGVTRFVWPSQLLWYQRTMEIPGAWKGRRVLLHFEAVDWHCVVWVNGRKVGEHKGGYVPFACDVTEALKPEGAQQVTLVVWDPSNTGDQSNGKQQLPRGGGAVVDAPKMLFAPSSGIWQSVWLEPVADSHIRRLVLTPDVDRGSLAVRAELSEAAPGCEVEIQAFDGAQRVAAMTVASSGTVSLANLPIPAPKLWSPASPFLYDLRVTLRRAGQPMDEVTSYFGMRKVEVSRDGAGVPRIKLNGEPVFLFGPLDSCVWPDGVLTPPSDEAGRFEVQYMKDIGCNMDRVHMTVRPERWYYWCDKLGLILWQDFVRKIPCETPTDSSTARQWEGEQREMMDHLYNHPAIMLWTVFNESWGQYDTARITRWAMELDPSRLVCNASGWNDSGAGHVFDVHDYSYYSSVARPGELGDRAMVLGECGGFNVFIPGHLMGNYRPYLKFNPVGDDNRPGFLDAPSMRTPYADWVERLHLLRSLGLCAAVNTQLYDTGSECNGWLTLDREVSKIPVKELAELHRRLYRPLSEMRPILPLLSQGGGTCRWQTSRVPAGWKQADFDDQAWPEIRTRMAATNAVDGRAVSRLYARRTFVLDKVPGKVALQLEGWGTFNVWLNGKLISGIANTRTQSYTPVSVAILSPQALAGLKAGRNVLAVEIQVSGGRKQMRGESPKVENYDFSLSEVRE